MSWACELTEDAVEDVKKLPRNIQERVARVLNQFETDPFQGDIKALKAPAGKELIAAA
jgi:mRNA-degrading endonuclease RelE of RelBE toxin-antitoxin system